MSRGDTINPAFPAGSFWRRALIFATCLYWGISAQAATPSPDTHHAQKVYTGIYLMNVYDLNINAYSYYADFYLWFRWKGDINPENIEFVNAVEKWGFTKELFYEEPKELENGYFYNGMRIEGRFYHSFQLADFPLDKHTLEIRIENVDYPVDSLVYLPDTGRFLMREDFSIPGWSIDSAKMTSHHNAYRTDFGEPNRSATVFSNFTFLLNINRPNSYFTLKLMLPLLVVILASLGGLFIFPPYIDARISLPIGGLLSCVFLQQSYGSALPDVGYMVLMDRIYLVSYLLIAAIMLRVILVSNSLTRLGESHYQNVYIKDRRLAGFSFFSIPADCLSTGYSPVSRVNILYALEYFPHDSFSMDCRNYGKIRI
ncbi:MAG: hypothetical protein IPH16_11545 [Haliscomenobacter sp.]|nr:hypothetical protein [Haliscomenobacter sp.]